MKHVKTPLKRNATVSVFTLLALLLTASGARADESDSSSRVASASKLSEEGLSLYKGRDYRHAIEKFLQAFALDPDPNLLFNTARCYEAMGDTDNAIEKYEAFLSKPDADPQGQRRATDAVRALREAKEAPPAIVAPASKPAGGTPAAEAGGSAAAARALSPAPQAEGSSSTAAIVTLSAGVVSLAAGAVSYALGMSDHNKVTSSAGYGMMGQVDPLTEGQAQALVDSGKTKKLIGVIGMGLGGALVATSAALFMFGSHSETPAKVAIGIAPTGDGGRLLLQGRF